MIKDVFERSDGTYGYPGEDQVSLERHRVQADGFHDPVHHEGPGYLSRRATAKVRPRYRPRTWMRARTCSSGTTPTNLDVSGAGGDITYTSGRTGFIYLATVLDCCTKEGRGVRDGRPHARPWWRRSQ